MEPYRIIWGRSRSLIRRLVPILVVFYSMHTEWVESAPPESIGIPILKSFLNGAHSTSPNGFKELSDKLLTGSGGIEKRKASPKELNNLISKLKPRQGKLDPVVMDMLSAFDRTYRDTSAVAAALQSSAETFIFPDETADTRLASSTEENAIIWQDTATSSRPQKRDRDSNRFSSRYRSSNKTDSANYRDLFTDNSSSSNSSDPLPPNLPLNYINDPNLRNHRLYAWEFETRNFTHIDQAEDLMADEDRATETKVAVVAPPPSSSSVLNQKPQLSTLDKVESDKKNNKGDTANIPNLWPIKSNGSKSKRVKVKGIPHIVISLEDTSGAYDHVGNTYNYQVPVDSGEHEMHRPREPLRHSSTENIVYVHDSAEEPYPNQMQEGVAERPYRPGMRSPQQFRPSSVDIVNDMFVDPDQDFFTSTIRSTDGAYQPAEQEVSSETYPKRRRKKLKKMNKNEIDEMSHAAASNRFSSRLGERQLEDEHHQQQYSTLPEHESHANHHGAGIQYSPVYSRNSLQGSISHQDRARAHQGGSSPKPSRYHQSTTGMEAQGTKSDRIMYPTGASPTASASDLTGYSMFSQAHQQQFQQQQQQPGIYDTTANGAHLHDGGIGNYYSLHNEQPSMHPHANYGGTGSEQQLTGYGQNKHPYATPANHEITSTEYLGGSMGRLHNVLSALNIFGNQQGQQQYQNGLNPAKKLQPAMSDQVLAPGNIEDFYHPYAASDHQVNQYYEDSPYYTSWSNTWFVLAGLIAFTAIFALCLPALLSNQRHGKKDTRHDLDEDDLNSSTYQGPPPNYHFDNTQDDVGQNSDLWTEIKGVYNDLVNVFRGDYSLLSKLKNGPEEGPKIVFRDEDEGPSSEEEEDDERESRLTLKNKKRQRFLKKQQERLKKQQQKHQQEQNKLKQKLQQQQVTQAPQQGHNQGQSRGGGGHSGRDEKTLLSKTESSRDSHGKTIDASSVNNLVVVSGPPAEPISGREEEELHSSSPRASTGFVVPEMSTLATMPFLNLTGYGGVNALPNSFLQEWAQVQLINHLPPQ